MKKIFLVFLFISLSHLLTGQEKITGQITDENKLPIVGATVFIPEMNKGTVSNLEGMYEISNLPNGRIKIQFSAIGYTSQIETIEFEGKTIKLNVTLPQTAIEIEAIVVSGGYNSTQHENAVKIEVLKLDPMTLKSTPNFMEALSKVPGVDMISKGSGVSKPVIRGLSMNDILVLNNGVRFENYQYSSHHPLGIDEFGIDGVEIIKGPASLLYGSDAIGGVINFIKEKPAPIGHITGDYNLQLFSNTLGLTQNFGIKGASNTFLGGIRVGQKTNSDFLQGGGAFVPNSRFNELSIKANTGYTDKVGTFKLFYDFNQQKLGLVEDEAVEANLVRSRKNEIYFQELNTHLLSSQNKLPVGKSKLEVNWAMQNTELIHFGEKDAYELQMQLSTLTYEARFHFPSTNKSSYIIGMQGINQQNTNLNDRETILLPNARTSNYSGFGMMQYTLFEKIKLQTGVRYDTRSISTEAVASSDPGAFREALDKKYGSFSGSGGIIYHFSEKLLFRANIAAAYRTPNLAELTSNGPHELRYEIGDPELVPENSYETDLSMHYHWDNITIDLAGFYNKVNNYIFISPTGHITASTIDTFRYKQENSVLYGGEAGIHFHPSTLKWLHIESTYESVIGKQENGDYLPFVPAHKFRTELRVEKEKMWFLQKAFASIDVCATSGQNRAAPDETVTPGYTLFDLSLGANIPLKNQYVFASIQVNNLLDKNYMDHLSTLKEVNFSNPGRNISLWIRIPFGIDVRSTN